MEYTWPDNWNRRRRRHKPSLLGIMLGYLTSGIAGLALGWWVVHTFILN
jgi:hypothetical protein